MKIGKEIIETLKEAREAKGLSQRALAVRSKVPQSHISRIERGQVDIQLSSLVELARVLELEVKLVPRRVVQVVDGVIRHAAPTTAERDRQARPAYRLDEEDDNV